MSNAFWLSGACVLQLPQIPGGKWSSHPFRHLPLLLNSETPGFGEILQEVL